MTPPQQNKHYPSTPRVRLHRARRKLQLTFKDLLFKLDTTEQLFTLQEQIEQLLIEAESNQL
ncbi:hypothetical protein D3879_15980 [Pseudomonas cavernicola]|uniref:Uncharacterized protein n=2 Tax=Pseudomonas cavernicola TaxID=2320866 RepID=A0A418XCJ6_9PSED|nr:hypothetical protein [Pseudomonas cavernicola]RJG10249.1 hypothetical protein D3879_19685 [Pseudomonas cavernicola]RJG10711.1 hypothetical protein D3879_15980 [Pseudomonas cavernicola]